MGCSILDYKKAAYVVGSLSKSDFFNKKPVVFATIKQKIYKPALIQTKMPLELILKLS